MPIGRPESEDSQAKITFVGHSTTLVEMSGVRVLTDPIFRDKFRMLRRRSRVCARCIDVDNLDAVVLSHMHFDHMDYPSLAMIPREVPIVAPVGAGRYLRRKVGHDVVEMKVGQTIRIGAMDIHATPSVHDSGFYWPLWYPKSVLSFVFDASHTVLFVGDTALFDDLREVGRRFDIDVAMLPVWGVGPYLRGHHMTPAEAAEALSLLSARAAIPIHWGTIHPAGPVWKDMPFLTEPPLLFARESARRAPMTEVRVLAPGESTLVRAVSGADRLFENLGALTAASEPIPA
jgi:L-ascorbate metabolism protein UlaG (beta-lactamase superfamily)